MRPRSHRTHHRLREKALRQDGLTRRLAEYAQAGQIILRNAKCRLYYRLVSNLSQIVISSDKWLKSAQ
jgi:hypothetical protein